MDDPNNTAAQETQETAGTAGETKENATGEQAGAGSQETAGSQNAGNQSAGAQGGNQNSQNAQGDEPPVRKDKKDFIIQRLQKKNEKLQQGGQQNGDPDEVDPEEEERISKVLDKRIAPITEALAHQEAKNEEAQIDAELNQLVTERPEFAEFKDKIRKFALHDSRKHLPLLSVAYEVAGDKLLQIGAERARKADKEAAESTSGGNSGRSQAGAKEDVWGMSNEEFAAKQTEVLTRQR